MAPAAVGQTITIMDKSGKIISTSKTLFNVFREAKTAYLDKKAEIAGKRRYEQDQLDNVRAFGAMHLDDSRSTHSHGSRRHRSSRRSRSSEDVRHSSGHRRDRDLSRSIDHGSSRGGTSRGLDSSLTRGPLPRRNTTAAHTLPAHGPPELRRGTVYRSTTAPGPVDMDLAYGELPPQLPGYGDSEVRNLFSKASFLLDEANCVGHSASKMIAGLQKNPESMAAVALTLAEISQVVSKLGPGALAAMKGSFPAVFALLVSPQFLIAAGVGVGITVVAFGGYKIMRQIKAKNAERDAADNNLEEVARDLHSIDHWQRGVADAEAASVATSVDGEFITPAARDLRRSGGYQSSSSLGRPPSYTTEARYGPPPRRGSDRESVTSRHSSHAHSRSHSYSSDMYSPYREGEREREKRPHHSRSHSERERDGHSRSHHSSRAGSERGSTTSSKRSRGRSERDRDREGSTTSSKDSRSSKSKGKDKDGKPKRGMSLRRVLFRRSSSAGPS